MKRFIYVFCMSLLLAACSYDSGHDCTSDEIELAEQTGVEDAMKVVALPATGMEHEEAILAIRAKEEQLRDAGFISAADAYADAAQRTLHDQGLIP